MRGKPSLLGACSGAIAGLVGVTPACGYIGVGGADPRSDCRSGGSVGRDCTGNVCCVSMIRVTCLVSTACGIVGCILTGIFASTSLGGVGYAQ